MSWVFFRMIHDVCLEWQRSFDDRHTFSYTIDQCLEMVIGVFFSKMSYVLIKSLPVSMLSLTIQVPNNKTASQCIVQPLAGKIIISPGTSSSVLMVSYTPPPRHTSIMSLPCTVFLNFFWFFKTRKTAFKKINHVKILIWLNLLF